MSVADNFMIDALTVTKARSLAASGVGHDAIRQVLRIEGLSETEIAEGPKDR